jgi:hypothetical protein
MKESDFMADGKRITQIPIPGSSGQTPTGAMQFQDDWPGLFIRGDAAISIAAAIRRLQEHLKDPKSGPIYTAMHLLSPIADIIEQDVIVR